MGGLFDRQLSGYRRRGCGWRGTRDGQNSLATGTGNLHPGIAGIADDVLPAFGARKIKIAHGASSERIFSKFRPQTSELEEEFRVRGLKTIKVPSSRFRIGRQEAAWVRRIYWSVKPFR